MDKHCKYSLTCFGCCRYNFPLVKMFRRIQNVLHFQANKQEYCNSLVTAVAVWLCPTGRPFTQQPLRITWSASSSSWVTALKWMLWIMQGKQLSWWQLRTVMWVLLVSASLPQLIFRVSVTEAIDFQADDHFFLGKLRKRKLRKRKLLRNSTFTQLKKNISSSFCSICEALH